MNDPKDYLLSVMNDPRAAMEDRIEAAKTLMPYFHEQMVSDDESDDYASRN